MFKSIYKFLQNIACFYNQLPEKPKSSIKVPKEHPWESRHENNSEDKAGKPQKAKGPAHAETKIFNHPRR